MATVAKSMKRSPPNISVTIDVTKRLTCIIHLSAFDRVKRGGARRRFFVLIPGLSNDRSFFIAD
jgi:hypothetical protein